MVADDCWLEPTTDPRLDMNFHRVEPRQQAFYQIEAMKQGPLAKPKALRLDPNAFGVTPPAKEEEEELPPPFLPEGAPPVLPGLALPPSPPCRPPALPGVSPPSLLDLATVVPPAELPPALPQLRNAAVVGGDDGERLGERSNKRSASLSAVDRGGEQHQQLNELPQLRPRTLGRPSSAPSLRPPGQLRPRLASEPLELPDAANAGSCSIGAPTVPGLAAAPGDPLSGFGPAALMRNRPASAARMQRQITSTGGPRWVAT